MSNDKMREAFEHWLKTDQRFKFDCMPLNRCREGFYEESRVEEMWASWRGALQSQQPESEPTAKNPRPVGFTAEMIGSRHGEGPVRAVLHPFAANSVPPGTDLFVRSPQPAAQVPEGWKTIVTAPHNREIEVTDGSYVVKAALEVVDYSEVLDRGLLGWVSSQFELDVAFKPTHWREVSSPLHVAAAPSIAEERKSDDGLYQNLYEMANQLIIKVGADGEICSKEIEFEQLFNAVLELEDAGPCRPAPPAGGE